jgi:Ca2+-binding EF-hand superfamily protein
MREITLRELQTMARRAGLKLSDAELEKLLPAVHRSHMQALQLRDLITDAIEPAINFVAPRNKKG